MRKSKRLKTNPFKKLLIGGTGLMALFAGARGYAAESANPLLDTLIKKGILTQQEADAIQAETATNAAPSSASKWKINAGIKSIELFGDFRFRYEGRLAQVPGGDSIERDRYRYAARVGLRGDLFDNFYYGLRLETSQNPRSTWVTLGSSKSSTFPDPSSKVNDGINLGQLYVGWKPNANWDLTVGRMPNPIYTTPMVWDPDIIPQGLAERFKLTLGKADIFATMGQFMYQELDPDNPIAGINPASGTGFDPGSDVFLLAWQAGINYHVTEDMNVKVAPVFYFYTSRGSTNGLGANAANGYSVPFVGQGAPAGTFAGMPAGSNITPGGAFYNNQVGINNLSVFEIPAEFNFKIGKLDSRLFSDFALNLQGDQRARQAFKYASSIGRAADFPAGGPTLGENKAYQLGWAVGNNLGLTYGTTSKKGTWEGRLYWQHIEQYALDVNLIDSDFFEGRGNLEGLFTGAAYSFTDNIIGTVRYGFANRINKALGTGGSNQDLPFVNPIDHYQILQFDLTYRF